jgi:hypothetical protein
VRGDETDSETIKFENRRSGIINCWQMREWLMMKKEGTKINEDTSETTTGTSGQPNNVSNE